MKYLVVIAAAAILAAAGAMALAEPKPSPTSDAWELEVEFQPLQAIQVDIPGHGVQNFWFLRYTVINHTGEDQIFVPDFTLYTDAGDLLHGMKGVPPRVYDQVKKVFNDPLLKDQTAMTGKLLQGEDNAKNGVAIFKDFDGIAGEVHIFIGGLSGETAEVELPQEVTLKEVDPKGNLVEVVRKKVMLAKTMDLTYIFPGNPAAKTFREQLQPKDKTWVMR